MEKDKLEVTVKQRGPAGHKATSPAAAPGMFSTSDGTREIDMIDADAIAVYDGQGQE
jgi:hypothetical protein